MAKYEQKFRRPIARYAYKGMSNTGQMYRPIDLPQLGDVMANVEGDMDKLGLPRMGQIAQADGLPMMGQAPLSESGDLPMLPSELAQSMPMLGVAQDESGDPLGINNRAFDEYGLPRETMMGDSISTSQSGTLVADKKVTRKVNNKPVAVQEAPDKEESELAKAEKQRAENASDMQVMGAGLKDLGSLFRGKEGNELKALANRMQKDSQFATQMEIAKEKNEYALMSATATARGKRGDADDKARAEGSKFGADQSHKFVGLEGTKNYRVQRKLALVSVGFANDPELNDAQVAQQIIFNNVKSSDETSAVLLAEFEEGKKNLGHLQDGFKEGGAFSKLPREQSQWLRKWVMGEDALNKDDVYKLLRSNIIKFEQAEKNYKIDYNNYSDSMSAYNQANPKYAVPEGMIIKQDDNSKIYQGLYKYKGTDSKEIYKGSDNTQRFISQAQGS